MQELKSHPLPLFAERLNPNAVPFYVKGVPPFTTGQMEKVFRVQQEELESDDEDDLTDLSDMEEDLTDLTDRSDT